MSKNFWSQSSDATTEWPNSRGNSMTDLNAIMLKEMFDQTGMLHEIKADVKRIPAIEAQVENNRLDIALLKADKPKPRERAWWRDIPKENWPWIVTVALIMLQMLANMAGQPQIAEKIGTVSQRSDFGDLSR